MAKNMDSIENMSADVRRETAKDSVKKTTLIRIAVAVMLIVIVFCYHLTGAAAVILIVAAVLDLVTMIPVWVISSKYLKDDDEEE